MTEPRVAIVTGGVTGIGLCIAEALAGQGHRVAVGARRVETAARNGEILALPLDVCEEASVASFCEEVRATLGPIGILVNAAGVELVASLSELSLADWSRVIDTNLTGPFLMTRAALPEMIAAGWGRIVNIASTAAHTAVPGHAPYCASKAGLLGLTRVTALEGAPHGVTCTSVSPTWVETDMLRASAERIAAEKGSTQAGEIAALAQANPQNRLVQPEEIAALVAFLCSEAAPGLTMEDISVNAGAHW